MTIADRIWQQCDRTAIEAAAESVAVHLDTATRQMGQQAIQRDGYNMTWNAASAGCTLEPGDGGRYQVIITQTPAGLMMTVAVPTGASYPLNGISDPTYVAEKWGRDNMWTGYLLDAFIRAFIAKRHQLAGSALVAS